MATDRSGWQLFELEWYGSFLKQGKIETWRTNFIYGHFLCSMWYFLITFHPQYRFFLKAWSQFPQTLLLIYQLHLYSLLNLLLFQEHPIFTRSSLHLKNQLSLLNHKKQKFIH